MHTGGRMTATLTAADIEAYVARHLAVLRQLGDKEHLTAQLMPGSEDALQCARRISVWIDACADAYMLSGLVAQIDYGAAGRIAADISSTTTRLIDQAYEARMTSIRGLQPA